MISCRLQPLTAAFVACLAVGLVGAAPLARSAEFPPAKSAAAIKDLIPLLASHKLDTFASKDTEGDRFLAVKYLAGVQMFAVSAAYDRPGDLEYFLDHKDFGSVYESLRSATNAKDRFIVDDAEGNGLVAQPKRSQPNDDAVFVLTRKTFDGVFTDPKHADPQKPSFEQYLKSFTDADDRYTHILTVLTEQLKKIS